MDVEPKPASLWWTSTCADEIKGAMIIETTKRLNQLPLEKKLQNSFHGYIINPAGKSQESFARADAASQQGRGVRDARIYKSKKRAVEEKCKRMVDQVYSVFFFGCESWSWSRTGMDKIQGWETKLMRQLFRLRREDEEPRIGSCMRTARAASLTVFDRVLGEQILGSRLVLRSWGLEGAYGGLCFVHALLTLGNLESISTSRSCLTVACPLFFRQST